MILIHNTSTILSPKWSIFNLFKWLWKCQDNILSISDDKILDIRIYFNNGIYLAHGLVTLGKKSYSAQEFINYIKNFSKVRIMLERNATIKNVTKFRDLIDKIEGVSVVAVVKKNGQVIRNDFSDKQFIGLNYEYWIHGKSFIWNLKRLWNNGFMTLKKYSNIHNKEITDEMIKDDKIIYEIDFV